MDVIFGAERDFLRAEGMEAFNPAAHMMSLDEGVCVCVNARGAVL